MALSNSERQARFRQRVLAAARHGVTPEDVLKVGRLVHDQSVAADEANTPDWDRWLADAKKRRSGEKEWADRFYWLRPGDIEDGEFGSDTDLVRRVAAVAQAMLRLPSK